MEPVSWSLPCALAPLMVAALKASWAVREEESLVMPFWRRGMNLSSSKRLRELLEHALSLPRETLMLAFSNWLTGAIPLASLRLDTGLWDTLIFLLARISISWSVTWTQWAAVTGRSNTPALSKKEAGV